MDASDSAFIRAKLEHFYAKYAPDKAGNVNKILTVYKGKENKVFDELKTKYAVSEADMVALENEVRAFLIPAAPSPQAASSPPTSPSEPTPRDRIIAIYSQYCPEKMNKVDATMSKYAGREEDLIAALVQKYGPEPRTQPPTPATVSPAPPAVRAGSNSPRDRVLALYKAYCPDKLDKADANLSKYAGREEDLIAALVQKYGPEPAPGGGNNRSVSPSLASPISSPVASHSGGSGPKSSYSDRAFAMYKTYCPEKLDKVEANLAKYAGREEDFIAALVQKYGPEPASSGSGSSPASSPTTSRGGSLPPRDRVMSIFQMYAPEKADKVDATMKKYVGREEDLIAALVNKYGPEPTAAPSSKSLPATPSPAPSRNTSFSKAALTPTSASIPPQTYQERIRAMYRTYCPEKMDKVDSTMIKYAGREEDFIAALVQKYGPEPTPTSIPQVATSSPVNGGGRSPSMSLSPAAAGLTVASPSGAPSYNDRAFAMYKLYCPEKLDKVEANLAKYAGREEDFIAALVHKYGPEPGVAPPRMGLTDRDRVIALYKAYCPEKLDKADANLSKYVGREEDLIAALVQKYGPEPTSAPSSTPSQVTTTTIVSTVAAKATTNIVVATPHDRIMAIYRTYCPEKLDKAEANIAKYAGREEDLIAALVQKYGPEPDLESSSAPATTPSPSTQSYYDRAFAMYKSYCPEKLDKVEANLAKYAGREEDFIAALVQKYGPEPAAVIPPATTPLAIAMPPLLSAEDVVGRRGSSVSPTLPLDPKTAAPSPVAPKRERSPQHFTNVESDVEINNSPRAQTPGVSGSASTAQRRLSLTPPSNTGSGIAGESSPPPTSSRGPPAENTAVVSPAQNVHLEGYSELDRLRAHAVAREIGVSINSAETAKLAVQLARQRAATQLGGPSSPKVRSNITMVGADDRSDTIRQLSNSVKDGIQRRSRVADMLIATRNPVGDMRVGGKTVRELVVDFQKQGNNNNNTATSTSTSSASLDPVMEFLSAQFVLFEHDERQQLLADEDDDFDTLKRSIRSIKTMETRRDIVRVLMTSTTTAHAKSAFDAWVIWAQSSRQRRWKIRQEKMTHYQRMKLSKSAHLYYDRLEEIERRKQEKSSLAQVVSEISVFRDSVPGGVDDDLYIKMCEEVAGFKKTSDINKSPVHTGRPAIVPALQLGFNNTSSRVPVVVSQMGIATNSSSISASKMLLSNNFKKGNASGVNVSSIPIHRKHGKSSVAFGTGKSPVSTPRVVARVAASRSGTSQPLTAAAGSRRLTGASASSHISTIYDNKKANAAANKNVSSAPTMMRGTRQHNMSGGSNTQSSAAVTATASGRMRTAYNQQQRNLPGKETRAALEHAARRDDFLQLPPDVQRRLLRRLANHTSSSHTAGGGASAGYVPGLMGEHRRTWGEAGSHLRSPITASTMVSIDRSRNSINSEYTRHLASQNNINPQVGGADESEEYYRAYYDNMYGGYEDDAHDEDDDGGDGDESYNIPTTFDRNHQYADPTDAVALSGASSSGDADFFSPKMKVESPAFLDQDMLAATSPNYNNNDDGDVDADRSPEHIEALRRGMERNHANKLFGSSPNMVRRDGDEDEEEDDDYRRGIHDDDDEDNGHHRRYNYEDDYNVADADAEYNDAELRSYMQQVLEEEMGLAQS